MPVSLAVGTMIAAALCAMVVYVKLFEHDLCRLGDIDEVQAPGGDSNCITSLGRAVRRALLLHLHCNQLVSECVSACTVEAPRVDEFIDLGLEGLRSKTELIGRAVGFIEKHFSCDSAAVVILSAAGDVTSVQPRTKFGKRFDAVVAQHVELAVRERSFGLSMVDDLGVVSCRDGLRLFGLRSALILPVNSGESQSSEAVYLWVGYRSEIFAQRSEVSALARLALEIGRSLQLSHRVGVAAENASRSPTVDHLTQISHDIRSPVNNVRAILDLFQMEGRLGGDGDLVEVAKKNCDQIVELVEDILDFARHQAGKLRCDQRTLSLRKYLEDTMQTFAVSARIKSLKLTLEIIADCDVVFDSKQLRRVFSNVIGNALKYTQEGGVAIRISEAGQNVVVTVEDSGIGMTEKQMTQLFVPFTRFSDSTPGIGLGLTMTKALLELNGGNLLVESQPGVGSKISIVLKKAKPGCSAKKAPVIRNENHGRTSWV